jgi:hypothetical protein
MNKATNGFKSKYNRPPSPIPKRNSEQKQKFHLAHVQPQKLQAKLEQRLMRGNMANLSIKRKEILQIHISIKNQ